MKIVPMLAMAGLGLSVAAQTAVQPELGRRSAPVLKQDGLEFKDLNRNGRLDVYEDWRRTPAERAKDLVEPDDVGRRSWGDDARLGTI